MQKQTEIPANLIGAVFGLLDENIKKIEKELDVTVINKGDFISVFDNAPEGGKAEFAVKILESLAAYAQKGDVISEQTVNYIIDTINPENSTVKEDLKVIDKIKDDVICLTQSGRPVTAKTIGQRNYIDTIAKNTITFGVGPAGTGKTYLAMAMAITAFRNGSVSRIILTRPAIEAGESLGFLPGDMQQKVDPYLRPLYDALHEIMGNESFLKNVERGLIEVAPLAYMRGRTLDNAYIILDEAQNTTSEQMKMFLTRLGFGSKAIITGDITQIDLAAGKESGLKEALRLFVGIEDIGIYYLTNKDVVRHPLIQKIIKAYESGAKKKKEHEGNRYNRRKRF